MPRDADVPFQFPATRRPATTIHRDDGARPIVARDPRELGLGPAASGNSRKQCGVSADRAEVIVRHTEVAFADAELVWRRYVRAYDPAGVVFFTGTTTTSCAGGAAVPEPFYCPETGTASFDLGFLDALADRLQRQRDLGIAVVAVRLSADHLQREMGFSTTQLSG